MIKRKNMSYYNALNDQERFLVDLGWKDAMTRVVEVLDKEIAVLEKQYSSTLWESYLSQDLILNKNAQSLKGTIAGLVKAKFFITEQ
jgi:hypothetical protein